MIRRPPRSTPLYSSAASDVYKRQHRALVAASFPKEHLGGRLRFSGAGGRGEPAVHDEAVAVLHQEMPPVREFGLLALDPGEAGVGVGGGGVGLVCETLPAEVDLLVAPGP